MSALELRRGGPGDAETLFAVHRESAMTAYVNIFPPDRYAFPDDEMRAHWTAQLGGGEATTVIAERSGDGVGFVVVSPGWLRSLFVLPAEWGRGAAGALHDEAVDLLGAAGEGARLWVLEANVRARRFYERRGWRHDGERRPSEYPPYPPALCYALDLERHEARLGGSAPRDPSQTPTHPGIGSRLAAESARVRAKSEPDRPRSGFRYEQRPTRIRARTPLDASTAELSASGRNRKPRPGRHSMHTGTA